MSFTEDELQSFNTILEQKLSAQRREMERSLDRRMNAFRRDIEERLVTVQQDIVRNLTLKLTEQQNGLDASLSQKLNAQQARIVQAINADEDSRPQQIEGIVDRMLAAQLLGIEQLLNQSLSLQPLDQGMIATGESAPHLEAIEVQTDLPWEDLLDVISRALDERMSTLNTSILTAIQNLEQHLSVRLHSIRDDFLRSQSQPQAYTGNATTIQEILHGIEHLERIIESMQVAMTANHALLSNRLYHHQQLPLERAHPTNVHSNGANNPNSSTKEHPSQEQTEIEGPKEQ